MFTICHAVVLGLLPSRGWLTKAVRVGRIVSGKKNSNSKNWTVPVKVQNHKVDRHPYRSFRGPPITGWAIGKGRQLADPQENRGRTTPLPVLALMEYRCRIRFRPQLTERLPRRRQTIFS